MLSGAFAAVGDALWDTESPLCAKCGATFGLLQLNPTRKHPCRFCGLVFCGECCSYTSIFGGVALPCCGECHQKRSQGVIPHIAQWVAETQGIDEPSVAEILDAVVVLANNSLALRRIGRRVVRQPTHEGEMVTPHTSPAASPAVSLPCHPDYITDTLDTEEMLQWGAALLEASAPLAQLRYNLVPARVPEECFWQRFFL